MLYTPIGQRSYQDNVENGLVLMSEMLYICIFLPGPQDAIPHEKQDQKNELTGKHSPRDCSTFIHLSVKKTIEPDVFLKYNE